MTDYLLLLLGFALLVAGGELLVRGAAGTAERLGMSPLLIGLTLVGFGTSMPELVTSVQASLSGSPGIAVGNIVGSNIANILLILGVSTLIMPLAVKRKALVRDGGLVLVTAALFVGVGFFLPLDRLVGTVFLLGLAGYLYYAYSQEKADAPLGHTAAFEKVEAHDEVLAAGAGRTAAEAGGDRSGAVAVILPLAMALVGLAVIVAGGKLLVDAASAIARGAGISETVIGLTVVAVGTSLPELVTSVVAALRRHGDVALGNVLGSNIYNILGIGGVTALIAPTTIPAEIARFDNPVMLGVSLLLLIVAYTGRRIARIEGAFMLAAYGLYLFAVWPV
ncbi:calcium/sodium antiporter [Rhizobiales bacterium]|uniref:calcium/sodium antiporter n=1 Tax=Hongsoonwoonella zoysiae TaxID=2821844 RepID=UPI00155FB497|nr:calcium/sodium antiporter [Hongsoonwoonella zoysiae]NRG17339.1 calcium/sodium antiporter [Hongsoonwoonella zoysiae]